MKGDFKELGRLVSKLGELAHVPEGTAAEGAAYIQRLITEEFQRSQDPYGQGWALLKTGAKSTLGTIGSTVNVGSSGSSIKGSIGSNHAIFHQAGTGKMVARPILPSTMPDSWEKALKEAAERVIKSTMEGG